jgi:iron complex outermembrane receptor protein
MISLNTSLGYLDTWIDKFTYQENSEMEGYGGDREAAMSPKVTGSFGVHFKNISGFFGLVQMSFKDEYYFSDSHNQKSKPYTLLNINIGKSFGKTMVKLWIRNALDERYTTRGFYFGLIPPNYPDQLWKSYGDPKQIGVTIDYTF